jgi:tetratricopeptide (TPR) repeat protein
MGFLFPAQRKIALLSALEISMKMYSSFAALCVRIAVTLLLIGPFAPACPAQTASAHLQQGRQLVMHGNCAAAETELHAALKAAPTLVQAQGLLGICEKRMGEPGAQAHLEAAFARVTDPRLRTEIGVELADFDYQRGDLDHALPVVRTLVAMNPENIDILFFAQNVYQDMADDTLNKLALLAPDSPRMQEVVAEHLVIAGDLQGAADHYREALQKDPYLPGAHFELAEAILEADPTSATAQAAAQKELELALRVDGESARIECEMGRDAWLAGDLSAAQSHYERARKMIPGDIEALMGLARILMRQDKTADALPLLEKVVDEDPLNGEAHYRYAMALKAAQRTQEAEQQIRIYQTIRTAHDKVASVYGEMNRHLKPRPGDEPDAENPQ